MASTPPPPVRVHTPPTPLHGAKYDTYEPYSPRRSTRVAAKRTSYSPSHSSTPLPSSSKQSFARNLRAATPPSTRKSHRTSSQTFSPPSSPSSPLKLAKTPASKGKKYSALSHSDRHAVDSDLDEMDPSGSTLNVPGLDLSSILPTPRKTPKKRPADGAKPSPARMLFQPRPATIDDAMPSRRKGKKLGFTLDSFGDDDMTNGDGIQIYTDSKERVPEVDEDEDNPFVGARKTRSSTRQRRKGNAEVEEMEQQAQNDEGIIYVFRGKKVFRKFENDETAQAGAEGEHESDADSLHNGQRRLRRQAGASIDRPLTRSKIEPRLLFPSEEQIREKEEAAAEAARLAEEEAMTDIEPHLATIDDGADDTDAVTPIKQSFQPNTPPSTGRATRSAGKKEAQDEVDDLLPQHSTRRKKNSPFDSWQRTKATSSTRASGKREGEGLDEPQGKRTRSGASHAS